MSKVSEIIIVHSKKVVCNGNTTDSGHPRIFLEINSKKQEVYCPYCSQHFIYKEQKNKSSDNSKNSF